MESWFLRDGGAVAVQVHSRQDVSACCTRHCTYLSIQSGVCTGYVYSTVYFTCALSVSGAPYRTQPIVVFPTI